MFFIEFIITASLTILDFSQVDIVHLSQIYSLRSHLFQLPKISYLDIQIGKDPLNI